jgi:peptidoglycan/xylan/chitin deacetylase (PgdA/CDA1 family)
MHPQSPLNYIKKSTVILIAIAALGFGLVHLRPHKSHIPAVPVISSASKADAQTSAQINNTSILPDQFIPDPKLGVYAPILLYHHIALKRPQASYFVSPEILDSQMKWLGDNNYKVISLDELISGLKGKTGLPAKPVVLTFDDGPADQYVNALPILKKYGFTATFYIIADKVGAEGYMSWPQVQELVKAGMTIGSHSVTHPDLKRLNEQGLESELADSQKIISQKLGITVKHFCYPGGSFNQFVANQTAKSYVSATTTVHRVYHKIKSPSDFYYLSRIHIDDELPTFRDWVRGLNLQ